MVDEIAAALKECASEIPAVKDELTIPADHHIVTAIAESGDAARHALDALVPAHLNRQSTPVHVLDISHVLLDQESFDTEIWTNLDRLSLAGAAG
ncbi:MAG TPA: hypothetical protein VG756_04630 [Pseudonocardiaceae bacterium]|nr:hypothetical protein [Pseudonocardiaceae bacterium]